MLALVRPQVMQKAASHQPTDASAHFERYEEQLQALHAQVDDLQIQLLQQSQAQVLIQVRACLARQCT